MGNVSKALATDGLNETLCFKLHGNTKWGDRSGSRRRKRWESV